MNKSVIDMVKISEKAQAVTPVEVNGRKHYVDLRLLHYEYLRATYRDGSIGIYLCCPDGRIEKDEYSVIEEVQNAI